MQTITYPAAEQEDETVSAFLMRVFEYGREIGLYGLLASRLKIAMKEVKYSLVNKAQTVIAWLVMGGGQTKAINEALGPERAAASYLGLERFPDQSPINRYLTRFSEENVKQLGDIPLETLVRQWRARQAVGWLVIDIDQCGLVANGKTYEFKRTGYFPRKRGEEGDQLSAAYLGAYAEAVQLYLEPGNVHCSQRLGDLLRDTDCVLTQDKPALKVIYRLDAGYDTPTNRTLLLDRSSYFLLKAHDTRLARKVAQQVPLQDWIPVDDLVHGTELEPLDGYRRLLYEFYLPDGDLEYFLMYTNLPADEFGIQHCFSFYNERQTVEAFFAQSRHVYNLQNLRSRQFQAI